jgi:hypothetical protein
VLEFWLSKVLPSELWMCMQSWVVS